LEINIYRLIQEGLNNIRKHADANHVKIVLIASYPNILLRIQDDGKGFDVKDRESELNGTKRMGASKYDRKSQSASRHDKDKVSSHPGHKNFYKNSFHEREKKWWLRKSASSLSTTIRFSVRASKRF
jgi:hypothetical protein